MAKIRTNCSELMQRIVELTRSDLSLINDQATTSTLTATVAVDPRLSI